MFGTCFGRAASTLARLAEAVKRKNFRCDFNAVAGDQRGARTIRGWRMVRYPNETTLLDFLGSICYKEGYSPEVRPDFWSLVLLTRFSPSFSP